jgi:RimJ/RimL family protein N-acetyltransferase
MKITFKALCESDLEWARLLHNDPEVLLMLTDPSPVSEDQQQIWFQNMKNNQRSERWVAYSPKGERIGVVRIDNLDYDNLSVCIGLDIHKDFRGRGYAKPIYKEILRLFFLGYGFNRVWLLVASYNKRAYGLYSKLGFLEEGRMRKALYRYGDYHDYISMSTLREEYLE